MIKCHKFLILEQKVSFNRGLQYADTINLIRYHKNKKNLKQHKFSSILRLFCRTWAMLFAETK